MVNVCLCVYVGNHTFYRRKICPDCGGNGGLAGACTICPMCMGEGVARHLYGNVQSEYQQMTETTCGKCRGKRCIPRVCTTHATCCCAWVIDCLTADVLGPMCYMWR